MVTLVELQNLHPYHATGFHDTELNNMAQTILALVSL
jgi:hypothetical protein